MYRIYKLIKNYPSIPVDWEIGMEVGVGDNQTMYSPCNSKYTDKKLLPYEIVQFPEFWKLVEEPMDKRQLVFYWWDNKLLQNN
jgi:hypothetical protein